MDALEPLIILIKLIPLIKHHGHHKYQDYQRFKIHFLPAILVDVATLADVPPLSEL